MGKPNGNVGEGAKTLVPDIPGQRGSMRISAGGRRIRKRKGNTQEWGKNIGAGGSRSARINADQCGSARMGEK